MGELVVITGPPGAGKSSVSEHVTRWRTPSVLVPGDAFFAMIKKGYVLPWLRQSRRQNEIVIEAAAAAAGRLSDLGLVVYDGILGPWFLPTFVRAAGLDQVSYVILLPPLEVCLERVRSRVDHGFEDLAVTQDMYGQFADAAMETRHLITTANDHPAQLAELIARELDAGQFRYSPS